VELYELEWFANLDAKEVSQKAKRMMIRGEYKKGDAPKPDSTLRVKDF